MCTAIGLSLKNRYFGRNLDLEAHFGESVVLTPRGFTLDTRYEGAYTVRYALLGTATVQEDFPLYAEAINEKGLAMAGLHFVKNAVFSDKMRQNTQNITTFELIPWVLGRCADIEEAKRTLQSINLMGDAFCDGLPAAPLHWFLTDGVRSLVLEWTKKGGNVFENPLHVLTNNPPFPYHLAAWSQLPQAERAVKSPDLLEAYGESAAGLAADSAVLPGGYTSSARFLRAAWLCQKAKPLDGDEANAATCFQILSAVAPIHGSVAGLRNQPHHTLYSVCADLTQGIFYKKEAESLAIKAYSFSDVCVEGEKVVILKK